MIEILSESTEPYDRGLKPAHYRQIASLQEYILVSQAEPRIEVFTRSPESTWVLSEAAGLDATIRLQSLGCEFPLKDLYDPFRSDS